MNADANPWRDWIGRTERRADLVTPAPLTMLSATLDRDDPEPVAGAEVPPLWHWLYFLPVAPQSQIGPDGHPRRGGFLPPVPQPRRMWAGGRLAFEHPLRVGDEITRVSRIADVSVKEGRSGKLVFVCVRHEISDARGVALTEEHDIVYRSAAGAADAAAAPQRPPIAGQQAWSRSVAPDAVLLFRYSALTFNGHRIHYDRAYVTEVEGYPGLVVHGPLIATLLLDLLRRQMPDARVAAFDFRAVRPTFDLHPFAVHGKPSADGTSVELWSEDHEGFLTMQGKATLA